MKLVKISAISYLNTKPFVYGIEHSGILNDYEMQFDIPSACAEKLLNNQVDIGIVPVAIIPLLKEAHILTDFCIGAVGAVNSVVLYSCVPLQEIETVELDYQSRTSVMLTKILAKNFWKINPTWINAEKNYEENFSGKRAGVVIGDRTFALKNKYPFTYDLSEEWMKFTGLPFVFACWVANKKLPEKFISEFSQAIKYGIEHRKELILELQKINFYATDVKHYLMKSISYELDASKKKALDLFLSYLKK
ncbi:MAG: menaquinone biosynthesis protein [Bacteroidia bacterium]